MNFLHLTGPGRLPKLARFFVAKRQAQRPQEEAGKGT
jgi:hypothetical protein